MAKAAAGREQVARRAVRRRGSSERPAPMSARSAWSSSAEMQAVVGVAVALGHRDDPAVSSSSWDLRLDSSAKSDDAVTRPSLR